MCRIDGTRDVCMRVASVCLIYTKLDSGYALFECSLKIYSRLESSNLFFFSEKCSASNVSVGARARVCGVFFISHTRQIELTWRQWCIAIYSHYNLNRKENSILSMEWKIHSTRFMNGWECKWAFDVHIWKSNSSNDCLLQWHRIFLHQSVSVKISKNKLNFNE